MVAAIRMLRSEDTTPYDTQAQSERRQGFAMIPAEVFAMQDMAALSVYAVLAKHANKDGECWPSIQTICEALGVSKKTVQPAIDRLIEAKIVTREHRFAHGMKQSNVYRITVKDANEQIAPTVPTLVPTVPYDGTHGSTGWHPQHHKQEPVELEENVKTTAKKPRVSAPDTPVPEDLLDLIPGDAWQAMKAETRLTDDQLRFETSLMIDRNLRKGGTSKNWVASWRSWMRSPYRQSQPAPSSNGAWVPSHV